MSQSKPPAPLDPIEALQAQVRALQQSLSPVPPLNLPPPGSFTPPQTKPPHIRPDTARPAQLFEASFEYQPLPTLLVDIGAQVIRQNRLATVRLKSSLAKSLVKQRHSPHALLNLLDLAQRNSLLRLLPRLGSGDHMRIEQVMLHLPGDNNEQVDLLVTRLPLPVHNDPCFLVQIQSSRTAMPSHIGSQMFDRILDSSDLLISACDTEGRCIIANRAFLEAIGRSTREVVGRSRFDFMVLRDAIESQSHDQSVLRTQAPAVFAESILIDDAQHDYEAHRFPLRDHEDHLLGIGCIAHSVTRKRQQEHHHLLSEAMFRSTSDGIVITDGQGRIERVNPAFERMSGFSSQTLIGRRMNILKSGEQDADFYHQLWAALLEHGQWSGEMVNRRASGEHYRVWVRINRLDDHKGNLIGYVGFETDTTQLHHARHQLVLEATTDTLTGLPNRRLFLDRLSLAIAQHKRNDHPFALLMCDLDHFKEVNDTLGHQVGDELLQSISQRLRDSFREHDTVARLGGDEFAVIILGADAETALSMAERMLAGLRQPIQLAGAQRYQPQLSVGLAAFPEDGDSPQALQRHADQALYWSKESGRNQIRRFYTSLDEQTTASFQLHQELLDALASGSTQLQLHWQPQFDLGSLAITGAEALIRWQHPRLGLLSPAQFLPVAEKHGLMTLLDSWVLDAALQQLADWKRRQLLAPARKLRFAINQSSQDLAGQPWLDQLRQRLIELELPPELIELELTERIWANPTPAFLELLRQLRAHGIGLSIDDFGTGYSSLAYLRQLPANQLKIDQSFVHGLLQSEDDQILIEAIINIGRLLGLEVLAEGIETAAQRTRLMLLGCQRGQGYLMSRALPADQFEKILPASASAATDAHAYG
ncbi:MAG: hypothetical protein RJA44_398 [Pseudomonadota bacterium]